MTLIRRHSLVWLLAFAATALVSIWSRELAAVLLVSSIGWVAIWREE